jgi:prepilin-type N-terminal cleavage/methylation domain-containing protein
MTRRRNAFTLVEVSMALAIGLLVFMLAYGLLRFISTGKSRWDVIGMTRRSYMQKDARPGLRQLMHLVQDAVAVVEPEPGKSSEELVVQTLDGRRVRVRREPALGALVSEQDQGGVGPVAVGGCAAVRFTAASAHSVTAALTLENGGQTENFLTIIEARNGHADY